MISDEKKRQICMALYSALAQDKVDFSTGTVKSEFSREQISYVKELLFIFGTLGPVRDKVRGWLKDFKLDQAAGIHKSNNPEMLWKTVDKTVGGKYGIPESRVRKARGTMRKIYRQSGHTPKYRKGASTIDEVQLSKVDFENIFDLFPGIQK